jgi:hypothetical protein
MFFEAKGLGIFVTHFPAVRFNLRKKSAGFPLPSGLLKNHLNFRNETRRKTI